MSYSHCVANSGPDARKSGISEFGKEVAAVAFAAVSLWLLVTASAVRTNDRVLAGWNPTPVLSESYVRPASSRGRDF